VQLDLFGNRVPCLFRDEVNDGETEQGTEVVAESVAVRGTATEQPEAKPRATPRAKMAQSKAQHESTAPKPKRSKATASREATGEQDEQKPILTPSSGSQGPELQTQLASATRPPWHKRLQALDPATVVNDCLGEMFGEEPDADVVVVPDEPEKGIITTRSVGLKLDPEPFCSKCGFVVDPLKSGVKLIRKTPPAFQCSRCNSKLTMLYSLFGKWPLDEFREIDEQTMQKFWQTQVYDRVTLKKVVETILVSRIVETQLAEDKGPFLPLATWAEAPYHFNVDEIKAKAPKRMHPILGETYQVKIVTTGERKQRDVVQETMCKLLTKPPEGKKGGTTEAKEDQEAKAEGSQASDDDDQSSDSNASSSSSNGSSTNTGSSDDDKKQKKKKKDKNKRTSSDKRRGKGRKKDKKSSKKNKKDKKAKDEKNKRDADKRGKAAAKLAKAMNNKIKTDAGKAMSKAAPLTTTLQQLLKDPNCTKVPAILLKKASDVCKALSEIETESREKLKAKDPLELTFTMQDVISLAKEAVSQKAILGNMLSNLAAVK